MRLIALICALLLSMNLGSALADEAAKKVADQAPAKAAEAAPAEAPPAEKAAEPPAAEPSEEKPKAPPEEDENALFKYLNDGGPMMYVILIVSMIGLGIFLYRGYFLLLKYRIPGGADGYANRIRNALVRREYAEADGLAKTAGDHPVGSVVTAGISVLNTKTKPEQLEKAMEKEILKALPDLERRIGLLSFLANSGTLLGLLGTIFGLIQAFSAVSAASAAERSTALAAGISTAMYTTAFGIVAAVPLLFFHHLLSTRQEEIIGEMELTATTIIDAVGEADAREEGSS